MPSAGLIVAAVALVVAMAGSAIAGPGADERKLSKASVKAIAAKQITQAAPGLSVKSAETAKTAETAETAKTAATARTAETARTADVAKTAGRANTADRAITADTAGSADNVMSASVPIAPSCTFDSNTGGITAVMVGTKCDVTFPVSVENCAVGATPLHPMEDVGGEATIRKLGGRVVKVTRNDPLGNGPAAGLFAITAICP